MIVAPPENEQTPPNDRRGLLWLTGERRYGIARPPHHMEVLWISP